MVNLNFQQPSLQSSVSHDYPEIILIYGFGSQILLSSLLKMVVLLNILWMYTFFFYSLNTKLKEQCLCKTEIFCKIINVFTDSFDQFNVSLQDKIQN